MKVKIVKGGRVIMEQTTPGAPVMDAADLARKLRGVKVKVYLGQGRKPVTYRLTKDNSN